MEEKIILRVLNHQPVTQTPIWLMRQAGRYLPEYRKVRQRFANFVEFCLHQDAVLEVTLQPLQRFNLDAAIIFSDILMLPYAMGLNVEFVENEGPLVQKADCQRVIEELSYREDKVSNVFSAINKVKKEMDISFRNKALIGFAGSPWTVACYMVEGKLSKSMEVVRRFSYQEKGLFNELITKIELATIEFLKSQIAAGVEIVKLFDSWAGILTPSEFKKWSIDPATRIVKALKKSYPHIKIIGFPRNVGLNVFEYARSTGIDCLAVDQFSDLYLVQSGVNNISLQGNLDNVLLACSKDEIEIHTKRIIEDMRENHFIFNLGHGVLPNTPIDNVQLLVDYVKEFRR